MGAQIGKDAAFLGVPMLKARNVLRAWRAGGADTAGEIATRKDVGLEVPVVAMLLQEFEVRGLIGMEDRGLNGVGLGLTASGKAFVNASGRARTPRGKAQAALDALLGRCAAVNADPDAPYHVDQVWVFGSMIRDTPDVGDIDVVVTHKWSPAYERIEDEDRRFDEARAYAAGRMPRSATRSFLDSIAATRILFEKSVFGATRNPLLSPTDTDDLVRLACPCRLDFDAARGGLVDDQNLASHPSASGRDPSVAAPLGMPDLEPSGGPILPVHSRFVRTQGIDLASNPGMGIFEPHTHDSRKMLLSEDRHRGRLISSEGDIRAGYASTPASLAVLGKGIDGQSATALLVGAPRASGLEEADAGILMQRSISADGNRTEYGVALDVLSAEGFGFHDYAAALLPVLAATAADVVRLIRLDDEAGLSRVVSVEFETKGIGGDADHVEAVLSEAMARPGAWLGSTYEADPGRVEILVNGIAFRPDAPALRA